MSTWRTVRGMTRVSFLGFADGRLLLQALHLRGPRHGPRTPPLRRTSRRGGCRWAATAQRTMLRPRHLSMDFLEKSHFPSCSSAGIRRSAAIAATVFSSMARYRAASFTSIVSFGSTDIASCGGPANNPSGGAGIRGRVGRLLQPLDLRLQRVDAIEHLLQRARQGIRQVGLVEIDAAGHPLPVAECYATRHPDHNTVLGHLAHHHRARADAAARADRERAEDLGPRSDHHVVPDGGMALLALHAGAAEGHALEDADVLADLGGFADHDPHAVVDEEAGPQDRGGVDLDAGEEPAYVGDEPGQERPAAAPQRVRHP